MRTILAAVLLFLTIPSAVSAQTSVNTSNDGRVSLTASAGPTLLDPGNTFSAGLGFTPTPRLTLSVTASRDHLNFRQEPLSSFRGGTLTTVAGEVRFNVAPGKRVSPYLLGGMGRGISRPNVTGPFTTRVTNSVQTAFAGAGLQIPIDHRLSVVADTRFTFVAEQDSVMFMMPVRVGLAFRF
jgi:hypothetical protein